MAKRYKPQVNESVIPEFGTRLPTNYPIAVYYRQSTDAQIGNISTTIQTVDMVSYLIQCGWTDDKIIMIDMDAGISGTTKIDERPGMSKLFGLITEGKIGAVACQDEDRLFRDVTQIQVNIFIEACKTSRVFVITPTMVYDFAHEYSGSFYIRQFRFKCEMAADYLNTVIKGKLQKAKRHLLMEGRWAGAGVPPGYMVDMRKSLPDGSENPNWRRYVPFEPYAAVIQQYFRMFLSNSGNLRATVREIHEQGPFYPDPAICLPPKGFKTNYKIYSYKNGYCPGREGLFCILTNAAYIGHWAFKSAVIRQNNHEPIITTDIFTRAFNYLSETSLDGKNNPHFSPMKQNLRPSLDKERPMERPLCAGMLVSKHNGKWKTVGTNWVGSSQHYAYVLWADSPDDDYIWGKAAKYVDDAVLAIVGEKLRNTFDADEWEKSTKSFSKDYKRIMKQLRSQLAPLERVMDNLLISLDTLTNVDMIQAAERRYEHAKVEYDRLSKEIQKTDNELIKLETLNDLRDEYSPAIENMQNMTRDEIRIILRAFIIHIEASPVENHGLHLVIKWKDRSVDEILLPRQATTGICWLSWETERLLELIESNASQIEIAKEFPTRKWTMIRDKVSRISGCGSLKPKPKPIKDQETYMDYLTRTGHDSLGELSSEDGFSTNCPNSAPASWK